MEPRAMCTSLLRSEGIKNFVLLVDRILLDGERSLLIFRSLMLIWLVFTGDPYPDCTAGKPVEEDI